MPNLGHNVFAILLAGGSGTRLWPISRKTFPKQLAKLVDENSLIQNTIKRLRPAISDQHIVVVCGQRHVNSIGHQMRALDIDPAGKIIGEPCGRNTAPAILLAGLRILRRTPEAVCGVFPADHVIGNEDDFRQQLATAVDLAQAGHIVTFGIRPHYPETGYGYIEGSAEIGKSARRVARFVEKPDLETAQGYVKSGNFFWNSGMFVFKAALMAAEFDAFQPDMRERLENIAADDGPISHDDYAAVKDISIDYAIMEKTAKGVVLPVDFKWSDIGSWKSLYDFFEKDPNGNVSQGNVVSQKVKNSLLIADGRLVAANRLDSVVVVETADAVFVSDLETSREVKGIVSDLKQKQSKEIDRHNTRQRGWGQETDLEDGPDYTVQKIVVDPEAVFEFTKIPSSGAQITVLAGKGRLKVAGAARDLDRGVSIKIAARDMARIQNTGPEPLVLVMVNYE